jgi:hypothetical protein
MVHSHVHAPHTILVVLACVIVYFTLQESNFLLSNEQIPIQLQYAIHDIVNIPLCLSQFDTLKVWAFITHPFRAMHHIIILHLKCNIFICLNIGFDIYLHKLNVFITNFILQSFFLGELYISFYNFPFNYDRMNLLTFSYFFDVMWIISLKSLKSNSYSYLQINIRF